MRILVTGAGGLIGRELTATLAERGHGVLALGRRSMPLAGNDGRAILSAPWSGTPPAPGQVLVASGDVCAAGLGLDPAALRGLDLIIHGAAVTGFNLDAEVYDRVNTGGTANVLATAGPVPILHISTAYVCGRRSGLVGEGPVDAYDGFSNDYERSKAAAEALVAAAQARGQRIAVARPSIVVGAHGDGAIAVFGSVYGLIRLVAEGRIGVLPATPGASLDLVPIDHVVAGLVDIAERMEAAAGKVFHLVSGVPIPVTALSDLAGAYPQLCAPRFVRPDQFDPASLPANEKLLHGRVSALLAEYLQRDPRFADGNLRALSGRSCPPTSHAFLCRLVDFCLQAGYMRSRRVAPAA